MNPGPTTNLASLIFDSLITRIKRKIKSPFQCFHLREFRHFHISTFSNFHICAFRPPFGFAQGPGSIFQHATADGELPAFIYPGCRSFVALPRATNIFPLRGRI